MIDRYKDTDGKRHYVLDGVDVLSVTTILNDLEEDTTGLDIWKKINNGYGDNADWEHLFWYKTYRGTLCHYQALVIFEEMFDSEDIMWGDGEMEALSMLTTGPNDDTFEDASHNKRDIVYSILKDQNKVTDRDDFHHRFYNRSLIQVARDDQKWFVDTFKEVCEKLGINEDTVISVEKFMIHELGYGGQCDLVYKCPHTGDVVVADLKTSSSLRQKHVLQAVAYSKAVEESDLPVDTVDRVEVIRLHPDSETWEVHSHVKATENHTTDGWFKDKYGNWEYQSLEEMWDTFCKLTEEATNGAG